ncbi:hypothetical protein LINGRAHAP2_LOCUS19316, partial [Linum grandiflorum]
MDFSTSDGASVIPEEIHVSSSGGTLPPRSKTNRPRTSKVWEHFDLFDAIDEEGIKRQRAKCHTCDKEYWADSRDGTSTMRRHSLNCKSSTAVDNEDLIGELISGSASSNHNVTQEGYRERLDI